MEDRLTPLDASFLHIEDDASHMHVGAVLIFDGDPPRYDDFVRYVESRLDVVPRYRQKLAQVPLAQARPRWVDDARFDVRFHVRDTALPSPGSEEQLRTLAARIFGRRLSRGRPLWELWLVQGLDGGRFAMISKTHHAVVDGIAGIDLISALFEPGTDSSDDSRGWRPRPEPSRVQLVAEALLERATVPAELYRFATSFVRQPRRIAGRLLGQLAGLAALARAGGAPAPQTPYNRGPVGPDRRVAWVRASLDDVKAIKNSIGGTVNDVVLTVVARALRRHLARRGDEVDELRVFVPVSVRGDEARGQTGNQVAGMIVPLPIASCPAAAECFQRIVRVTRRVKDSGEALGAHALVELQGFAPPTLLSQGARLSARQRFVNLVVTNVPGPQHPLSMGRHELLEIFPLVPLGANLNLGVAVLSYNGRLGFGLVGDFDALPDLEELVDDFAEALAELAEVAGVELGRRREPKPVGA